MSRLGLLARLGMVLGDHRGVLVAAAGLARQSLEPLRHSSVVDAAGGAQQALVGDIAQQGMTERELGGTGKGGALPAEHDLPVPQPGKGVVCVAVAGGVEVLHRAVPEDPAHHRRSLRGGPFVGGEGVEACLDDSFERRWHPSEIERLSHDAPTLGRRVDYAFADEPLDQLLHEERVALGRGRHQVGDGVRHLVGSLHDLADQLDAVPPRQGPEAEHGVGVEAFAPVGASLEEGRSGRHHYEDGPIPQPSVQVDEPVEGGVVRPVGVLEEQDHWRLLAQPHEVVAQRHQRPGPETLRVGGQALEVRAVGQLEAEPAGEQVRRSRTPVPGGAEIVGDLLPLGEDDVGRIAGDDAEAFGEHAAEEAVGHGLRGRRGTTPQQPDVVGSCRQPRLEVAEQSRLAHPGVPDDAGHGQPTGGAVTVRPGAGDVVERLLQPAQLEVPADGPGGDPFEPAGLRPVGRRPPGQRQVRIDRLRYPLEPELFDLAQGERALHQLTGVVGQENAPGWSGRLETSGPVDDLAHHHHVTPGPVVHLAHHDVAGVDSHPHLERDAVTVLQLLVEVVQPIVHGKRRSHGPVGVVLAGSVHAEHRHHRVADELLDDAALVLDATRPNSEILCDDRAHVFRIELTREHGEVDQVGEQDGHLFALVSHGAGDDAVAALHQWDQRQVDHGVTDRRALLLERGNGVLDRLQLFQGALPPCDSC